jgi:hypothetical protein
MVITYYLIIGSGSETKDKRYKMQTAFL